MCVCVRVYTRYTYNRSLFPLCDRNLLCIYITISQFFPNVKRSEETNVQPDMFLNPIPEAEALSDILENENLLSVSSPMPSTLDYGVLKSFKKTFQKLCLLPSLYL